MHCSNFGVGSTPLLSGLVEVFDIGCVRTLLVFWVKFGPILQRVSEGGWYLFCRLSCFPSLTNIVPIFPCCPLRCSCAAGEKFVFYVWNFSGFSRFFMINVGMGRTLFTDFIAQTGVIERTGMRSLKLPNFFSVMPAIAGC